jgi:hypothetical protein
MTVSIFGLIWPIASQRTIASMIRWAARPMLAPNICKVRFSSPHYALKAAAGLKETLKKICRLAVSSFQIVM